MLYRQRFDTFIRTYNDIGYIINKSNFTDQIVDKVGSIFLSSLSRNAKDKELIINEIVAVFPDIAREEIAKDLEDFYYNLEEDGFIVSGQTIEELEYKDRRFSYSPKVTSTETNVSIMRTEVNSQKYLDDYFKKNPRLVSLQIEISSKCNERCIHCYIPHKNKNKEIEPSFYYDVLKQCKDLGVLDITLSGGEPMLHPHFAEFLREAKKSDFSVTILSNLTLLTDEILDDLKNTCLSGVQVSLYSMDNDIHDSITKVKGSCEKTKKSIISLIENNIPIQISCPTMRQNMNSYADVAKWAAEHGIRAYTDCVLMARYDHTTDNLTNRMSLNDTKKVINDIIKYDEEYQQIIRNTDFCEYKNRSNPDNIICSVGLMSMCMNADGKVFPCAGWQSYVCGDAKNHSLRDIWNNSPELNYLRGLRKKDLKDCVDCNYHDFCAVCMARNANENSDGDPLRVNKSFCEIAKLNKEIVLEWNRNCTQIRKGRERND